MIKTLTVLGTRPEAIKLAPLVNELSNRGEFNCELCSSGQHKEMLQETLDVFQLSVDYPLELMTESQTLPGLTSRTLTALDKVMAESKPDCVIVQGDTTTAFVAALAGFYRKVPVGHVEAGLRSGDKFNPFPEEANRRLTDILSELHFVPTEVSRENLIAEGFPKESIWVTGNTVIDALLKIRESLREGKLELNYPVDTNKFDDQSRKLILVTAHRRESHGEGIREICLALKDIIREFPNLEMVFPVHLNPKVQEIVYHLLQGSTRIHLTDPLDYFTFVGLMEKSTLIITDSGGIQEEAPALGKPVLVAREKTERPEAVQAGTAKLVGTNRERIFKEVANLIENEENYKKMATAEHPFGKGDAAEKIAEAMSRFFSPDKQN